LKIGSKSANPQVCPEDPCNSIGEHGGRLGDREEIGKNLRQCKDNEKYFEDSTKSAEKDGED